MRGSYSITFPAPDSRGDAVVRPSLFQRLKECLPAIFPSFTATTVAPSERRERRPVVLCLDDDPISTRLVRNLLDRDFEVLTCQSVGEAIALARCTEVTFFISDFHLGHGITGSKALRMLQSEVQFEPVDSVLITGHPTAKVEAEARAVGFSRCFPKPLGREFRSYFRPEAKKT